MLIIATRISASPIHGFGVFTELALPRGAIVSEFRPPFDLEFPPEAMTRLSEPERRYLLTYAYRSRFTGHYLLTGDHDRFMNHSDLPNVGMNPDGSYSCLALRDIAAGEELTCDYRAFDADWALKLRPQ